MTQTKKIKPILKKGGKKSKKNKHVVFNLQSRRHCKTCKDKPYSLRKTLKGGGTKKTWSIKNYKKAVKNLREAFKKNDSKEKTKFTRQLLELLIKWKNITKKTKNKSKLDVIDKKIKVIKELNKNPNKSAINIDDYLTETDVKEQIEMLTVSSTPQTLADSSVNSVPVGQSSHTKSTIPAVQPTGQQSQTQTIPVVDTDSITNPPTPITAVQPDVSTEDSVPEETSNSTPKYSIKKLGIMIYNYNVRIIHPEYETETIKNIPLAKHLNAIKVKINVLITKLPQYTDILRELKEEIDAITPEKLIKVPKTFNDLFNKKGRYYNLLGLDREFNHQDIMTHFPKASTLSAFFITISGIELINDLFTKLLHRNKLISDSKTTNNIDKFIKQQILFVIICFRPNIPRITIQKLVSIKTHIKNKTQTDVEKIFNSLKDYYPEIELKQPDLSFITALDLDLEPTIQGMSEVVSQSSPVSTVSSTGTSSPPSSSAQAPSTTGTASPPVSPVSTVSSTGNASPPVSPVSTVSSTGIASPPSSPDSTSSTTGNASPPVSPVSTVSSTGTASPPSSSAQAPSTTGTISLPTSPAQAPSTTGTASPPSSPDSTSSTTGNASPPVSQISTPPTNLAPVGTPTKNVTIKITDPENPQNPININYKVSRNSVVQIVDLTGNSTGSVIGTL
jgi:hypothetical protein